MPFERAGFFIFYFSPLTLPPIRALIRRVFRPLIGRRAGKVAITRFLFCFGFFETRRGHSSWRRVATRGQQKTARGNPHPARSHSRYRAEQTRPASASACKRAAITRCDAPKPAAGSGCALFFFFILFYFYSYFSTNSFSSCYCYRCEARCFGVDGQITRNCAQRANDVNGTRSAGGVTSRGVGEQFGPGRRIRPPVSPRQQKAPN